MCLTREILKNVVRQVNQNNNYSQLCKTLQYQFNDMQLLATALTHRSLNADNNERLEFLGDSILNFTIAQALFENFPSAPEGDLSRLRAALVKGDTLAEIASEMGIGVYLRLGEGELKSGGSSRPSILADAVEAIIGAIYLDASIETVRQIVLSWFTGRLQNITLDGSKKDPKTLLQEWLQARKQPLPEYEVTEIQGESHNQLFTIQCRVKSVSAPTVASASSRKSAEKAAASLMLSRLGSASRD